MFSFSKDPGYAQWLEAIADLVLAGPRQESAPTTKPERLGPAAPTAKATPDGDDPPTPGAALIGLVGGID